MPQRSDLATMAHGDSDSISLTSSDDEVHDPDTEFVVEDIHCERVDPADGILKYLVEWSNFPIDEDTWEPEYSISEVLKQSWEKKKARQDPRIAVEYEKKYEQAFNRVLNARRERHRRRNAKRRRLGLEKTDFYFRGNLYPDSDEDAEVVNGKSNDSYSDPGAAAGANSEFEEAQEDSTIDHKADRVTKSGKTSYQTKTPASPRTNKAFSADPSATRAKSSASSDKGPSRQKSTATTPTGNPLLQPKARSNSAASSSSRQRDQPPTTGYQGSVRRASTGTTQAKSAPIQTPSSDNAPAKPPTSTSTLTKKGLTSKKSGKAPIAATNIFTGGKKRQPRQNLASAMVDPSKGQKLFTLHRFRRKAELRSRDHDDQAPDVSKVAHQLFSINQIPPTRQTPAQNSKQSEGVDADTDMSFDLTDEGQATAARRSSTSVNEPKSALLKTSSFDLDPERPKKRAKTVRFTGEDGEPFVSEPVNIDELPGSTSRIRSPPPPPRSTSPPPEPKRKLSLTTYHSRIVQNVEKKIVLSTGDRSLYVTFHDIPKDNSRETGQQWLREFCGADSLQFAHTVLAESIIAQLSQLRGQDLSSRQAHDILCHGKITSANCEGLDILAEHLRVSHSGLFTSNENYNLVIYPTRCDGFQMSAIGIELSDPPDVALKHFVFRSSHSISRLIRPPSALPEQLTQAAVGKGQKALFRSLLGMRYAKLIAGPRDKKDHHFFLMFPEAAVDWYRSISCWLSVCNPHCKIYTSFDAGSWSAFLERANSQCGVVIIHETAVDFVRRFPSVAEILQTDNNYTFWRFSAIMGLQQTPSPEGSATPLAPDVFSRIFPMGKAILVTPSFLVCEPLKTLLLFEWFFGNQTSYCSNKLVTAYNIVDFLRDLASEANQLQAKLKHQRWIHMSELEAADERNALGLSDQDLIARGRVWAMGEDWLSVSMERNGVFSEENHAIFADRCIDPNDEQSLVNWFGWWSLMKVGQYRKFYIVGSGPAVKQTKHFWKAPPLLSRASRSFPVPVYDRFVVNDPNEALRALLKKENDGIEDAPARDDDKHVERVSTVPLQSQTFANNERNIPSFLRETDRGGSARIFGFPVSWADSDMADHFGDTTMEFSTLKQWFSWPYPWLGDSRKSFNTYIALFYTIQEDWDPNKFPRGLKPTRHPWIAIYRPWEPHQKWDKYKHGKMELIFWDLRAGNELEANHSLCLSDLNWMQREVVKFVQAHGAEKNPGSKVDRVWLGGFRAHQKDLHSTLPADMTAEFLQFLSSMPQLKWKLPSTDGFMRQNGWREVSLLDTPVGPRTGLANTSVSTREDDQDITENNEDIRIVFHPPRGSSVIGPPRSSKCTNDLFEQARLSRLRTGKASSMSYTFKPTMEWYADLVAEGRQYEHVYVDRWEKVFEQLKVGQRKQKQTSRVSSVSSNHSSPVDESSG